MITQGNSKQSADLRLIVMRNENLKSLLYNSPAQKHIFRLLNDKLISIASFSKEIYPDLPTGIHYRLRGMATLPEFRNNHAGSSLIQKAEQILQERQANILWCNGRITVADYYKRLGFQEHGEIFEIEPIGLHKVLYKRI
ncbi:GNAT family N-acetyltransferase [Bacillus sp. D-CC]